MYTECTGRAKHCLGISPPSKLFPRCSYPPRIITHTTAVRQNNTRALNPAFPTSACANTPYLGSRQPLEFYLDNPRNRKYRLPRIPTYIFYESPSRSALVRCVVSISQTIRAFLYYVCKLEQELQSTSNPYT